MGGGADGGGLEGLEEEEAAVVGLVASTAGDELGDVERRKERVEVLARFAWPAMPRRVVKTTGRK